MKSKILYVVRGLPCVERNELASTLGRVVHQVDDSQYATINIDNEDDVSSLHDDLLCRIENNMEENDGPLVVCGPLTYNWEVEQYLELADKHRYEFVSLIHTCSADESHESSLMGHGILDIMADRFELTL